MKHDWIRYIATLDSVIEQVSAISMVLENELGKRVAANAVRQLEYMKEDLEELQDKNG